MGDGNLLRLRIERRQLHPLSRCQHVGGKQRIGVQFGQHFWLEQRLGEGRCRPPWFQQQLGVEWWLQFDRQFRGIRQLGIERRPGFERQFRLWHDGQLRIRRWLGIER